MALGYPKIIKQLYIGLKNPVNKTRFCLLKSQYAGQGVKRDFEKSKSLMQKSYQLGDEKACDEYKNMGKLSSWINGIIEGL